MNIITLFFHTINLINLPSFTNISLYLIQHAYTCSLVTGFPSFFRCSPLRLISRASVSVDIPQPAVDSKYTTASSIFIPRRLLSASSDFLFGIMFSITDYHPYIPDTETNLSRHRDRTI